jgi:cytochrome c
MSNFELNKIIASLLLAGLVCMIAKNVADIVYVKDEKPLARGYAVKIDNTNQPQPQAAAPEIKIDIPALMVKANLEAGREIVKKCISCHNFNKGESNKIGPLLWEVVGRDKGSEAGYGYSKAMQTKGGKWDYESLFAFLRKPSEYVPGTKMSFAGLAKAEDIANVIAFLRSKSDNPAPLP